MAGMEEIEIHSKSYLVRWVNARPDYTISWTVQPHKKSINFGIFKHPGHFAGGPSTQSSSVILPPPSPNPIAADADRTETESIVIDKLTGIGLKTVLWAGKCEADKVTQGKYEVPPGEAGNYALVFDNTFSKSMSKTATFFLLTYPTSSQSQIQFGAQLHHSQSMASAIAMASSQTSRKSPKLRALGMGSVDSLRRASASQAFPPAPPSTTGSSARVDEFSSIHTGVLQKRRRKKHQGYARRFFCLDYTSSTLSYYHDKNSSALRGAIPLSLAAIGANAKSREISIDSGAEIWHLRANNHVDFGAWKTALEKASRLMVEASTSAHAHEVPTGYHTPNETSPVNDQEWARLETLLSRISGTRDAVRRLCLETLSQPLGLATPRHGSGPPTPIDAGGEDYFRGDERRPFWKRKASTPNTQGTIFKRSVSAQLAVPLAGVDPALRNGTPSPGLPSPLRPHYHHEEGMYGHCKALLHDLDSVVAEFSTVITENRIRRAPVPKSAISRLSMQSVESQEYFDAEDKSPLLEIPIDSDHEESTDTEAIGEVDSATSSEIGDDTSYMTPKRAFKSGSLTSLLPPKAKSLVPLPMKAIARRMTVPAPTIMPPSLIGFLRKNMGKDLSTIAMPVSANEPTSLLQRAAEQLEYSELLDQAARGVDKVERLIYVTAFAISALSNVRVKERSIRKPFNPMLGETFELVREDKGFRFVAEKVSHRPVQLAFHAEAGEWSFTQSPLPSQKFWGKSSEIITEGKARLVLHSSAECFSWSTATCFLRNVIAGEKYVEPVGTMTVVNETNSFKAVITFKAKGMFSGRSEEVDVQTFDGDGALLAPGLQGTWTQSLYLRDQGTVTKNEIWAAGPLVNNAAKHYGMTAFAATLNEVTEIERGKLAATDSRLRPDQSALEDGSHELAEKLKNQLEEGQRARRKEMEAAEGFWQPRWFSRVENGGEVVWKLRVGKDGYWEERARGEWTGVVPVLEV